MTQDELNKKLFKAIRNNKPVEEIKNLLESGADPNFLYDEHISPLLADAAWLDTDAVEVTELLLKYGANPNFKDFSGRTPLMEITLCKNCEALTKLYLDYGADINAKDKEGKTVLMYAKSVKEAKLYLDAGADIEAKDNEGRTVLMQARTEELTEFYLKAGANPNVKDIDGKTALMLTRKPQQTKLLLEYGADPFAADYNGNPVSSYIFFKESVDLLVKAGVDAKIKEEEYYRIENLHRDREDHYSAEFPNGIRASILQLNGDMEDCYEIWLNRRSEYANEPDGLFRFHKKDINAVLKDIYRMDENGFVQSNEVSPLLRKKRGAAPSLTAAENIYLSWRKHLEGNEWVNYSDYCTEKYEQRKHIERRKKAMLQGRKLRKAMEERDGKLSGTSIADKIAEDVISGKEKRTITPKVGAELRRKKLVEYE